MLIGQKNSNEEIKKNYKKKEILKKVSRIYMRRIVMIKVTRVSHQQVINITIRRDTHSIDMRIKNMIIHLGNNTFHIRKVDIDKDLKKKISILKAEENILETLHKVLLRLLRIPAIPIVEVETKNIIMDRKVLLV